MKRIPMERLISFGVEFLRARGVPAEKARFVSELIVETEAFRQSTHGVVQFRSLHGALGRGMDPAAEPRVVAESGALAVIDANGSLPILAMKAARDRAIPMAREQGSASVLVRNSGWIAALSPHAAAVAREGLLCFAWAQSSSCEDCAPFGGIDPCFSTNPVAFAFPTAGDPVVADFSTSTMSMGATSVLAKRNQPTETPRFLDGNGAPTCDPSVVKNGGTLMFAGGETEGYKGYAMSLFNEALSVMAGGSANNPEAPGSQNFGLTALDPEHGAGRDYFVKEMKRFMARVRASRPRAGVEKIRLPGERGFAALAECRAHGVPLDDEKIEMLNGIAADCGVAPISGE